MVVYCSNWCFFCYDTGNFSTYECDWIKTKKYNLFKKEKNRFFKELKQGTELFRARILETEDDNKGEILTGDGVQKIAKDNSVIADGGSTYIDYREATIVGEIDEPPILTEQRYPVLADEYFGYSENVADSLCRVITPGNANNYCFLVDFSSVVSKPEMNRWIGYTIQSLPMSDWRTFVNENYVLEFKYMAEGDIRYINLEITNASIGKKLCRRKLELSSEERKFCLPLGKYIKSVEDWKSVNEICFVFFPEECVRQKGSVFITDVVLIKEV